MDERVWKVGELAAATGLTVRTLHHFDEIGLLRPTGRSAAGHRLYTAVDARRLSHVLVLRELGMPLREIGRSLDADPDTLAEAVGEHLARAQQRIGAQQQVRRQLRAALRALRETPESTVDGLIDTMEALMKRTYFTPEQLAALKQRHREAGAGGFMRWERRWSQLCAEAAAHQARGADPAEDMVQQTAREWTGLMDRMTGGDRGIMSAMYAKMDDNGAEAATRGVVSGEVWEFMKRAFAVGFGGTG